MELRVEVCNLVIYIFGSGCVCYSEMNNTIQGFKIEIPIKGERNKEADVVCGAMRKICSEKCEDIAIMTFFSKNQCEKK